MDVTMELGRCRHGSLMIAGAPDGTQINQLAAAFPCGCRWNAYGTIHQTVVPKPPKPPLFAKRTRRVDFAPPKAAFRP